MIRTSLAILALLAGSAPSLALEFPIRGVFGVEASDCKAAKEEQEGAYVAFEAKASTGEGGAGGCDFASVKEVAPKRYEMTGLYAGLDQPKKRLKRVLVVSGPDAITYDGQDYRRCK